MSSELKKASVGPVFIGGILVFLLFGLLVWIWFGFAGKQDDFEKKRADARAAKLDALQKESHEKLSGYAWINKDKGIVQLPIARAQEIMLADLKAKAVQASSVKVEHPYPAGLQQAPVAAPATTGTGAPAPAASGTNAAVTTPAPSPAAAASPAPAAPAASVAATPAPATTSTPVP